MKICLVGSGNLGSNLGKSMMDAKMDIIQVISRNIKNAKNLAQELNADYTDKIEEYNRDAEIIIFSVSDDSIPELLRKADFGNRLLIHTAGSVSQNVFEGHSNKYGILYPLQTFSKEESVCFKEIPIFTESNKESSLAIIDTLAKQLSTKVYHATSDERLSIHVAAVFACNFTNHLYHIAHDILQDISVDFDVFAPLLRQTAERAIKTGDPIKSQTGPALRQDEGTMQKHLEKLKQNEGLTELYKFMSNRIFETKKENPDE